MKTVLKTLVIWLGFWLLGATVVHADEKPLPPDFDPLQGGMVLRPPKDLWVQSSVNNVNVIPIAYLPGGAIKTAQLSQVSYRVEVDGQQVSVPELDTPSKVLAAPSILTFGVLKAGGLGILFHASQVGDFQVKIFMQLVAGGDEYTTDVTLHVRSSISATTWANTSTKSSMNPLPQLVLWHHLDGEVTVDMSSASTTTQNEVNWPTTPLFYLLPPTRLSSETDMLTVIRITTIQQKLTVASGTATQAYGLSPIQGVQGQPITLDLDYIHPRLGTKLQFIWRFYQTTSIGLPDDIVTSTPSLSADQIFQGDGTLQLVLRYSNGQQAVEYLSNPEPYTYQSAVQQALPPTLSTITLADLINKSVTINAGLADWQVDQPQRWHLNISVSPLKQVTGETLLASLRWPNGSLITPTQPYSATYNDSQRLPLSQIDWVFQQQPHALAGHYQAEIQIQAIAGP